MTPITEMRVPKIKAPQITLRLELVSHDVHLNVNELVTAFEDIKRADSIRVRICSARQEWCERCKTAGATNRLQCMPDTVTFTSIGAMHALDEFVQDRTTHAVMLQDICMSVGPEGLVGHKLFGMTIEIDDNIGDDIAFVLKRLIQ